MLPHILVKLPLNKLVFVRDHDLLDRLETVNDYWVHVRRVLESWSLELPILRHDLLNIIQINVILILHIGIRVEFIHDWYLIGIKKLSLGWNWHLLGMLLLLLVGLVLLLHYLLLSLLLFPLSSHLLVNHLAQ